MTGEKMPLKFVELNPTTFYVVLKFERKYSDSETEPGFDNDTRQTVLDLVDKLVCSGWSKFPIATNLTGVKGTILEPTHEWPPGSGSKPII